MTALPSNEFGFSLNGDHSRNYNIRIIDITRNIFAEPTENEQTIPGRKGTVYFGTSIGHRIILVDIKIVASSNEERNTLAHNIANWLMDTADQDDELIFDDEADKDYYGHFATDSQITRSLYSGAATLEFHCSDPFSYKEQVDTGIYTSSPVALPVSGQVPTKPIINVKVNADITSLALTNSKNDYLFLGSTIDPDQGQAPANKTPAVFGDPMTDSSIWAANTDENYINGTVAGQFQVSAQAFLTQSADYGTGSAWHGPSLKRFLSGSQQLQDFRMDAVVWFDSQNYKSMGVCRIYLIDANNNSIGYICLKDNDAVNPFTIFQAKAGTEDKGHDICYTGQQDWMIKKNETLKKKVNGRWISYTAPVNVASTNIFNGFYGILSIQRIGNVWTATITKWDNKNNPQWKYTYTWTDASNQFTGKLAGVAIYNAAYGTAAVMDHNQQADIKVYQIIDGGKPGATEIPVIATAGDEIMVDCEAHKVLKNGELFMTPLLIGSTFFDIQAGTEVIGYAPADKVDIALSYRPKYM
ncbi:phage tail family protein [Sporolactobacillus sp. CQH2019]|uniref:distal tail protein Dit n=1 Tax=Sporolactobacillus sp. CQH2019 TaxID=3023512 RepID=UPI002367C560|nr:distal tail protein Dit [Sporolactobacillus sp. CQH2019]MDD9147821.1 phage tail family protein [Sporolactobacillus sp. CQH2019]